MLTEPCGLSYRELQHLSDDDLMEHLRLSHDDALTVLFDRYHRLVLAIALKILRDRGEAETEMKEKKARVEDAMHATRAAVEEALSPAAVWP